MKINLCRQDSCSIQGFLPLSHLYAFNFNFRVGNSGINLRRSPRPALLFQSAPDKRFNSAESLEVQLFSETSFCAHFGVYDRFCSSHSTTLIAKRNFYPISMFVLVQLLIQILTLFFKQPKNVCVYFFFFLPQEAF